MAVDVKYEPTEKQVVFHKDKSKFRLYGGAVGGGKCLTENHEVLTKTGWISIKNIKKGDIILAWKDWKYHWQTVKEKYEYYYDGDILCHRSKTGLSFEITPNHRIPTFHYDRKIKFKYAKDIVSNTSIPATGQYLFKGKNSFSDDELKLWGFWLAEGSYSYSGCNKLGIKHRSKKAVRISQTKTTGKDYIREILDRLKIRYTENNVQFYVQWYPPIECGNNAYDKFIPEELLTEPNIGCIFEGLIEGDGYKRRQGFEFSSSSEKLIDNMQHISVLLGYRTFKREKKVNSKNRHWLLSIYPKNNFTVSKNTPIYSKKFNGKIYCVSVDNTAFITRCNGGVHITGNSVALVMEGLKLSLKYPKNRGFMCRKVFNDFRKTTMLTFFEFVPNELIKDYNKADAFVELINGSTIQFGDLESENKIKSMNLGWFAIDEVSDSSYEDFMMLVSRLRYKPDGKDIERYGIMATNPEPCWVKDLFIDHINPTTGLPLKNPQDYSFTPSLPSDNPHNPDDYVETLRDNFDPEWVKKYVEGNWTTFKGLIYKEFNRDIHVSDFEIDWRWNFYRSVDFGVNDPTACIYIGVDGTGRWWIFDEYYSTNDMLPTQVHAEEILAKYPKTQYHFRGSVGDGHALGKQLIIDARQSGLSLMEVKQHKITEGINRVKHQLRVVDGKPLLNVHPRCINIIREFGRYQWAEQKNSELNPLEKPRDSQNHCLDALKNFAMQFYGTKPLSQEAREYLKSLRKDKYTVSSITGY